MYFVRRLSLAGERQGNDGFVLQEPFSEERKKQSNRWHPNSTTLCGRMDPPTLLVLDYYR